MLSLAQLRAVCPAAPEWALDRFNASLEEAQATTPARVAMLLAQTAVETRELRVYVESLSYSAERLIIVWPHRFPALALARPYEHQPEKLANLVYAGRLGNGDESSGDGWKYRGRGSLQITGCDNYLAAGLWLDLPLRQSPDMAALPEHAFRVGAWAWRAKGCNQLADTGDVARVTRRINGGAIGLAERIAYYERARAALGVP